MFLYKMVGELIGKYVWLIETIRSRSDAGMTLGELASRYEESFGEEYSRSSFNNHRSAVEEIFGVEIKCNRSTNSYYIPFSEEAVDSSASKEWLIDTFTVNNLLTLGKERLSGRVSLEDIPSGHRLLPAIVEAMKENVSVRIEYVKYGSQEVEIRHVRPYAVKEFDRRWYLVGYSEERKQLRVYSLDRIRRIDSLEEKFRLPAGFNVDDLFHDSYGVYLPEPGQKALSIVFRCDGREASYLRDLPIHHSQKEIPSRDGMVHFRIRVIPNDNLIMNLGRYGPRIEVLEPPPVRDAVARFHQMAASKYGNNK